MICPLCKSEYREGFIKCADCDVDLVDEISNQHESEFDPDEIVEILQLSNFTEISFVKSLLESENIICSSSGESVAGKIGGGNSDLG